jgi:hypothetical protein
MAELLAEPHIKTHRSPSGTNRVDIAFKFT